MNLEFLEKNFFRKEGEKVKFAACDTESEQSGWIADM